MSKPIVSATQETRASEAATGAAASALRSTRSVPLATAGGAILALGLVRGAATGDAGIGVWLAAALPALAGAGFAARRRIGAGRELKLKQCLLGAYAATAVIVAVSGFADPRLAAALFGAGIVGAAASAMLVAGLKGQTVGIVGRESLTAPDSQKPETVVRLATAKERGRWLIGRRPDDELSVVYLPDRAYVGTLDYDDDGSERGPFRAQVVKQEGRVTAIQVFVPGVGGGYVTDLRCADGESGLSFPDQAGITEGLGTNVPGYFAVAETQRRDILS